jgi:REP element-mobilizing transposase RayT
VVAGSVGAYCELECSELASLAGTGLTAEVARQLRIQYPGALCHVINRGNYQSDVFETASAATAFTRTLAQACERHGWRLFACVLMRNHYHLALETPEPNLALGMQWLQTTFAARFNRFRFGARSSVSGSLQGLVD